MFDIMKAFFKKTFIQWVEYKSTWNSKRLLAAKEETVWV